MKRPFQVNMRRSEIIGGAIWLVIYGFFMGEIVGLGLDLLGIPYTTAQLNAVFFLCNFVITALVFWRFLTKNLMLVPGNLLRTLKAMLLGFCIYWLLQVGLQLVGQLMPGSVEVPNDDTIASIAGEDYRIMWAGAVLLAPVVEETLVRGLVFGNVRRLNRVAAYAAAAAVFAAMHVLSYLGQMDALTLGYNILVYGLPSIALCACYEYAGNIWAPVLLHMVINAVGMSAL